MSVAPLTAAHRLAQSREHLRLALCRQTEPQRDATNQRTGPSTVAWLSSLKAIPGAGIVIEALSSWWAQHPLRVASMVGADVAKAVVQPLAQRHPLGLVLGAMLLGGLLFWSRPWRWVFKPALFAGLLPQLFYKALIHLPVQSWMAAATSPPPQRPRPQPPAEAPSSYAAHH